MPDRGALSTQRIGHLGEIGRWLDNAPDEFVIERPKTVPWYRRTLVVMPRWIYFAACVSCVGFGFVIRGIA